MKSAEFLNALEDAIGVAPGTIKPDQLLIKLGCWDSMAALSFMALADEKFQIEISGSQMQGCKTVQDLIGLLGDKISQ